MEGTDIIETLQQEIRALKLNQETLQQNQALILSHLKLQISYPRGRLDRQMRNLPLLRFWKWRKIRTLIFPHPRNEGKQLQKKYDRDE